MARTPRAQKTLLELYGIAVDEYRFEVKLNWDRMQYYAVVNSGIIAVGAGLLRETTTAGVALLSGAMFSVGLFMALMGVVSTYRSREYYHATIFKKTIYEELLGLNNPVNSIGNPNATLAIGTTNGQKNVTKILAGRPSKSLLESLFRNRVVSYFMWLLLFLALIDLAGIGYTGWRAIELFRAPVEPPKVLPAIEIDAGSSAIISNKGNAIVRVTSRDRDHGQPPNQLPAQSNKQRDGQGTKTQ